MRFYFIHFQNFYHIFLVFYLEFKYRERNKRDVSDSRDEESSVGVPVEVRFNALGRQFHFELEAASQPFTDMSHVLIRRWVYYGLCDVYTACVLHGKYAPK